MIDRSIFKSCFYSEKDTVRDILLHREFHQVCVHEEPQQEVVDIIQFLWSSHVQHQDACFRFPAGTRDSELIIHIEHSLDSLQKYELIDYQQWLIKGSFYNQIS